MKDIETKLVDTLRECEWSDLKISELLARKIVDEDQEADLEYQRLRVDDELLNQVEYIKVEVDSLVKEREKTLMEDGQEEESDEDF